MSVFTCDVPDLTPADWMLHWLDHAERCCWKLTGATLDRNTGRGYAFIAPWQPNTPVVRKRPLVAPRRRLPVQSDRPGERWGSRMEAAEALGVTSPHVAQCIKHRRKCAGRYLSNAPRKAG